MTRAEIARYLVSILPRRYGDADTLATRGEHWTAAQDRALCVAIAAGMPQRRLWQRVQPHRPGATERACERRWERLRERYALAINAESSLMGLRERHAIRAEAAR
jgi:hypothetical protein